MGESLYDTRLDFFDCSAGHKKTKSQKGSCRGVQKEPRNYQKRALRDSCFPQQCKGRTGNEWLPETIQEAADSALVERIFGSSTWSMDVNEKVTMDCIQGTLGDCVRQYNDSLDAKESERNEHNDAVMKRTELSADDSAFLSTSDAAAMLRPKKRKLDEKVSERRAIQWAEKFGWRDRSTGTGGKGENFLDYDHPKMKAVRDGVRKRVFQLGVDPELTLNIDHTWRKVFRPRKKVMWKPPDQAGEKLIHLQLIPG